MKNDTIRVYRKQGNIEYHLVQNTIAKTTDKLLTYSSLQQIKKDAVTNKVQNTEETAFVNLNNNNVTEQIAYSVKTYRNT